MQLTITLPAELNDQIESKAQYLRSSVEKLIPILLRSGLAAQAENEQRISTLAERVSASQDDEESRAATDQLGEFIFGK